jgi:putative membrane protein insertion efficiency factor
MKRVLITLINFYQRIISPLLHQLLGIQSGCRRTPTCSAYAKEVISEYGIGKGLLLAVNRVLNCQPFFSI